MQTPSDGPAPEISIAFVTCEFSCNNPTCAAQKVPVNVIARAPGEDVVRFVERVGVAAAATHARISPECAWRTCDLKIPVPKGDGGVGEPTRQ